jgi:hypothetical protein
MPKVPAQDWQLSELARLGAAERELELDLLRLRREIAGLITELLPPHAPQSRIQEVVAASGFSRHLIEAVRGGSAMWGAD